MLQTPYLNVAATGRIIVQRGYRMRPFSFIIMGYTRPDFSEASYVPFDVLLRPVLRSDIQKRVCKTAEYNLITGENTVTYRQ